MPSWMSEKLEKRKSPMQGFGVFAKAPIKKGEAVIEFGANPGKFINGKEADILFKKGYDYMVQIDDDLFLATTCDEKHEDVDYINHSCDPNCGFTTSFKLVAMRDIETDEEITFDYVMSDSSHYELPCRCGSKDCRGKISGTAWKDPALQEKYKGFFQPYLQKKIDKLKASP